MTNRENLLEDKYDGYLSNFIIGYFFVQALNLFVKLVLGNLPYWTLVSRGFLIVLLLYALIPICKRELGRAIVIEGLFGFLFAMSVFRGSSPWTLYSTTIINALTVFVPMSIAALSIKDTKTLLHRLYVMSWPTQIILLGVLLSLSGRTYSMPGGYALTFQLLIILDHFFEKRKWYDLVAVILDFVVIIIFGSRGPVLCIATLILLKVISSKTDFKHRLFMIIATAVLAVTIILFYDNIINSLLSIATSRGYSSRNLRLLLSENITFDSGRSSLLAEYFEKISKKPLFGYGIIGGWNGPGYYPHNIIVEMYLSFGYIIGSLILINLIIRCYQGLRNDNESKRRILQILISYCVSLFMSDSFVMFPAFFLLLGFSNVFSIRVIIGRR